MKILVRTPEGQRQWLESRMSVLRLHEGSAPSEHSASAHSALRTVFKTADTAAFVLAFCDPEAWLAFEAVSREHYTAINSSHCWAQNDLGVLEAAVGAHEKQERKQRYVGYRRAEKRVGEAWERLCRFAPAHRLWTLNPGASHEAITAKEASLKRRFPPEVRASFVIHNGQWCNDSFSDVGWLSFLKLAHNKARVICLKDLKNTHVFSAFDIATGWPLVSAVLSLRPFLAAARKPLQSPLPRQSQQGVLQGHRLLPVEEVVASEDIDGSAAAAAVTAAGTEMKRAAAPSAAAAMEATVGMVPAAVAVAAAAAAGGSPDRRSLMRLSGWKGNRFIGCDDTGAVFVCMPLFSRKVAASFAEYLKLR
ncbi:unnamed protein product [Phaeothamnion confervicola]